MTPRRARLVLVLLAVIASAEVWAAARAYRTTLTDQVWADAAAAVAALPPDEPVALGSRWLGPLARMHLPALRSDLAVAPPDLLGLPRFHVLGHVDSPNAGAWSAELADDLADLPPPVHRGTTNLGPLQLHHYEQPAAGLLVMDWLTVPNSLQLHDRAGRCRRSASSWTCKHGRVAVRTVEVAYRPRRCFVVDVDDGASVEWIMSGVTLGDQLRGHLGFAEFNGRLRSDAPALVELYIDDAPAGQWTVTDSQGWAAFAAETPQGRHDVRVRLTPTLGGTWTDRGYSLQTRRSACLELRAFAHTPVRMH